MTNYFTKVKKEHQQDLYQPNCSPTSKVNADMKYMKKCFLRHFFINDRKIFGAHMVEKKRIHQPNVYHKTLSPVLWLGIHNHAQPCFGSKSVTDRIRVLSMGIEIQVKIGTDSDQVSF
jgi:hypothetical protein